MTTHTPLIADELAAYLKKIEPLKAGFDMLRDHVVITDRDAHILYMNKTAEQVTGYSFVEAQGKNPADLWGGHMPNDAYEKMWQTVKVDKQPFVGEVRNTRKDGTEYWQELHISPVLDSEGEAQLFVAVEPNITDRKEREQFREEFISILGHQLRNPLTATNWALSTLVQQPGLNDDQRSIIESVYAENKSLLDLVSDLLVLARMGSVSLKREEINLAAEVAKIVEAARGSYPQVSFAFSPAARELPLLTNPSLARQVFTNLINNAGQYADKEHGEVAVAIEDKGQAYAFSCANNGLAIAEADKPKIFSRLFRAESAKAVRSSGSGLGLFIVKMIADSFGWKAWFESEPGKPTTFFVGMPKS